MLATEEVAGTYNVVHRYLFDRREDLPLPTAFLVNATGEIVKIYSGARYRPPRSSRTSPRSPPPILPPDWRAPLPFPGVFASPPTDRSYFQYGLELSEQGYDAPALVAFERVVKTDPSAIAFYNLGTLDLRMGQHAGREAGVRTSPRRQSGLRRRPQLARRAARAARRCPRRRRAFPPGAHGEAG